MNRKPLWQFFCVLSLLGATSLSAGVNAAVLSFETSAVVGSGFTPGRQVVLFGEANPPQPFTRRLKSYLQVITADGSGGFRWEAPEPIASNSVWFAIGSVPGDQVAAVPWSASPPQASLPAPVLLVGRDTGNDAISISAYMADIVVIRPDGTVWLTTSIRHGSADLNRGLPGKSNLPVRSLHAMAAAKTPAPALTRLTPADTVVVVEPVSFHFYIGRLTVN
jgi:hypothetical protein